jgi:hypothetical protein
MPRTPSPHTSMIVLGTPSAELGKALEGADVQVYTPYQSM